MNFLLLNLVLLSAPIAQNQGTATHELAALADSEGQARLGLSALLTEQSATLKRMYAERAAPKDIQRLIARIDSEAQPLFSLLNEEERASLEREIEMKIAGELWGLSLR